MDHDDASGAIPPVPRRADGPGRARRDVARLLMAASVFVRVAEAETFGRLAPTDICLECVRIFKGQVGRGGRVANLKTIRSKPKTIGVLREPEHARATAARGAGSVRSLVIDLGGID